MRLSALSVGLLIAATIVPVSADAGPVRAAARGTATAVAVTGKTAVKGTVVVGKTAAKSTAVVGRTAARGTVAVARTTGRGVVCVATLFHRCGRPYPWPSWVLLEVFVDLMGEEPIGARLNPI
jgi:hypothetical protein